MTNIPIEGKIISIEVEDDSSFGYAEYTDGQNGVDPPTIIEPTGYKISIIKLTMSYPSNPSGFKLSNDFNPGDIVEFYTEAYDTSVLASDNSNFSITVEASGSNSSTNLKRLTTVKKIFDGSGNDWACYRGNH